MVTLNETSAYYFWVQTFMVVLMVGLAAWAVYTDLDRGIVSNRNVLALLVLGFAVQAAGLYTGRQSWRGVALLAGVALAYGLVLYLFDFWAAGDGKLFAALCLAIPSSSVTVQPATLPMQIFARLLDLRPGQYLSDYLMGHTDGSFTVVRVRERQAAGQKGYFPLLGPGSGAIQPEEVQQVHRLVAGGRLSPDATIAVKWAIPFAPFIALGAILVTAVHLLVR